MKKLWFGALLLAVLLAAGIWNARCMRTSHQKISALLTEAADMALTGNTSRGADLAKEAQTLWEKKRNLAATVADHTPLEEVDSLLSQLDVYATEEEAVAFAACCRAVARQVDAVGEAQSFNWQNLL